MRILGADERALFFMKTNKTNLPPNDVAAYVRTATTDQHLASNQMDVIREYAKRHGMQIVEEYSDVGKSGVSIRDREALQQMVRDVESGQINFSAVLLHDVSRWGRFQEADESAYYEYLCRRAGVAVHYCAGHSETEVTAVSTIIKCVKVSIRANENGH
jgi:DNA invertase Pin-like site-specific DNA recombinase